MFYKILLGDFNDLLVTIYPVTNCKVEEDVLEKFRIFQKRKYL